MTIILYTRAKSSVVLVQEDNGRLRRMIQMALIAEVLWRKKENLVPASWTKFCSSSETWKQPREIKSTAACFRWPGKDAVHMQKFVHVSINNANVLYMYLGINKPSAAKAMHIYSFVFCISIFYWFSYVRRKNITLNET